MTERPILFSGEMVRAILDGRKTQTRRVVRGFPAGGYVQPLRDGPWEHSADGGFDQDVLTARCPYGQPGDRLWVREAHAFMADGMPTVMTKRGHVQVLYRARCQEDDSGERTGWWCGTRFIDTAHGDLRWRPSIFMPRWASRLTLEVEGVRVERLQDITEADARAEGITDGGCLNCGEAEPCACPDPKPDARESFIHLWDSIYGKKPGHSWTDSPWVWVVTFKRVEP